jgi:hypothetical protein
MAMFIEYVVRSYAFVGLLVCYGLLSEGSFRVNRETWSDALKVWSLSFIFAPLIFTVLSVEAFVGFLKRW